jgi:hypothetical protein
MFYTRFLTHIVTLSRLENQISFSNSAFKSASVLPQLPGTALNLKPVASLLLALSLRYLSVVSELIPETTPRSLQRNHLEAVTKLEVQLLGVTPRAAETCFL